MKNINQKMPQLTPERRQLMLRVLDGDQSLVLVMFSWNKRARVDEVLKWLIANRYIGKDLSQYMFTIYGAKVQTFFQWVLSEIDRTKTPAPIILGKDYRN